MKLRFILAAILFSLCATLSFSSYSYAHDIFPAPVMDFLNGDYYITEYDIDLWLKDYPALQGDEELKESILTIVPVRNEEYLRAIGTSDEVRQSFVDTLDISFWDNMLRFVYMGVIHILEGTDHVLFVLSFLLVPLGLWKLLKIITTFTVAHSITLVLAGSDFFTLSASIVEPIIALSIAYVALTSVFLRHIPFFRSVENSLLAVFFFGLFHGLGFAGVFQDIGIPSEKFLSSLLSFNIGVEIGQIVIVLLAVPIFMFVRKYRNHEWVIRTMALLMSVLAIVWFVMRIT